MEHTASIQNSDKTFKTTYLFPYEPEEVPSRGQWAVCHCVDTMTKDNLKSKTLGSATLGRLENGGTAGYLSTESIISDLPMTGFIWPGVRVSSSQDLNSLALRLLPLIK